MRKDVSTKILRKFGWLVGGIFGLIGTWPLIFRGSPLRLWAIALAGFLILSASILPRILLPFYRGWMVLGHYLGWINTKIILGVLFYLVFTPVGAFRRLFSGDSMSRKYEPDASTYRVVRQPRPGAHMRQQF